MNTCIAYTHTYTHMNTHTDTIHQIKINCILIYFFTSQVMDSQVNSEALNNLLENDMISQSRGEPNIDLLGSDPDTNSREDMHITKPFSILNELVDSPPTRNSTNTTTSTPNYLCISPNSAPTSNTMQNHPSSKS